MLKEKNVELEITENARSYLAENGYSPAYGARPLRRLIEQEIVTPVAKLLLDLEEDGNKHRIVVDATDDGLTINLVSV